MLIKSSRIAWCLCVALTVSAHSHSKEIRINQVNGAKEELVLSILKLAVSKSSPRSTLKQIEKELPVSRLIEEANSRNVDLLWAGSSAELDENMLAVRIPLLKGLLGHRIFIIRNGDQARFDKVSTLSDLKKLKAGMGKLWGSTKVLQDAGLSVTTAIKYPSLFHMLEGARFDYFPRAVHEPWSEIAERSELNLTVEKRILLIYPYAMYFYVRKDNTEMHNLLKNGLEAAIADGSFNALFYSNPMIKSAVEKTNFSQRLVMRIDNPAMHPDTPINRPELWLDVANL